MIKYQVGQVLKWDFQADVFEGEFRLVEDLGNGAWEVELLPPSEELIEEAARVYASGGMSLGGRWVGDQWVPKTADEAWVDEITERQAQAGTRMRVQFVSAAEYARHF